MKKIIFLINLLLIIGCTNNGPTLTPARELEGTWETTFPITFYIKTDFNSIDLEDVGSEEREMTWEITRTNDPNMVNIQVSWTTSNRTLITGSGYTPDIPLMDLTGTISSTELTLKTGNRVIGVFSFTTDLMMGTWNDSWELAYAQEVYTKINELKLIRKA